MGLLGKVNFTSNSGQCQKLSQVNSLATSVWQLSLVAEEKSPSNGKWLWSNLLLKTEGKGIIKCSCLSCFKSISNSVWMEVFIVNCLKVVPHSRFSLHGWKRGKNNTFNINFTKTHFFHKHQQTWNLLLLHQEILPYSVSHFCCFESSNFSTRPKGVKCIKSDPLIIKDL